MFRAGEETAGSVVYQDGATSCHPKSDLFHSLQQHPPEQPTRTLRVRTIPCYAMLFLMCCLCGCTIHRLLCMYVQSPVHSMDMYSPLRVLCVCVLSPLCSVCMYNFLCILCVSIISCVFFVLSHLYILCVCTISCVFCMYNPFVLHLLCTNPCEFSVCVCA